MSCLILQSFGTQPLPYEGAGCYKFRQALSRTTACLSLGALALSIGACNPTELPVPSEDETAESENVLSGTVIVDGSSTVFPITDLMTEEFMQRNPNVGIIIGVSGSGGGFDKLCEGDIDIANASRPIGPEEIEDCTENGVEFVELPIAFDGISVVINPENDWATCLDVEDLRRIWEPAALGSVMSWHSVRNDFPDEPLSLYAPGNESGTFDYFTEVVMGEIGKSRADYVASEDDNVLVQGVQTDIGGLGYFGFAYFKENADALNVLEIRNPAGSCVAPSAETIADGSYAPLSRPLFIYVKKQSLATNPAVAAFAQYHLESAARTLIEDIRYVALPQGLQEKVRRRLDVGTTGSMFSEGSAVGVNISDRL
ncbi:MAG: PstS family phosphate ABC transporter substrate-binding protein [Cyanobacteria bacterium P01_H01_bin.15]